MSSPVSCHSPASQSSYCNSIFSYNGSGSSHTLDEMSNITTPDSATPKEAFSPLMFASPSPSLSSELPTENMVGMAPLSPPANFLGYAGSLGSSPSPPHSSLSQYPQEYYRPQPPPVSPQPSSHIYPPSYIPNQRQYSYAPQLTTPTSPYASGARNRSSLPPIDPNRFEEEEWYTPSGKKVRHSAMHLHCATM